MLAGLVLLAGCAGGLSDGSDGPAVEPTNESPPVTSDEPPTTTTTNGTLKVHFINAGQSVSTLIISPSGETMLVDTGHYRDDGTHVLAYLQRHDIERIDHLVTSHADADHIGGHAAVIDYYETEADGIGTVYDPGIAASTQTYGAYLDAVAAHNVTLYETRAGDAIAFAGVDVAVLGPPEPYPENSHFQRNLRGDPGGEAYEGVDAYAGALHHCDEVGTQIVGLRRGESGKREPKLDGLYGESFGLRAAFPIRDWSAWDVWAYLVDQNVPYPDHYDRLAATTGDGAARAYERARFTTFFDPEFEEIGGAAMRVAEWRNRDIQ